MRYVIPSVKLEINKGEEVTFPATYSCPFNEYFVLEIAFPPLLPFVNVTKIDLDNAVNPVIVGGEGVVRGIVVSVLEYADAPTRFTVRIFTPYEVPFVNPVMINGDDNEFNETSAPLFKEYI